MDDHWIVSRPLVLLHYQGELTISEIVEIALFAYRETECTESFLITMENALYTLYESRMVNPEYANYWESFFEYLDEEARISGLLYWLRELNLPRPPQCVTPFNSDDLLIRF